MGTLNSIWKKAFLNIRSCFMRYFLEVIFEIKCLSVSSNICVFNIHIYPTEHFFLNENKMEDNLRIAIFIPNAKGRIRRIGEYSLKSLKKWQ